MKPVLAAALVATALALCTGPAAAQFKTSPPAGKPCLRRHASAVKDLTRFARRQAPILRYPSGETRWLGWKLPKRAQGTRLSAKDFCSLNLGYGYVDPVRNGAILPRKGGLLFRLSNGGPSIARRVNPVAYQMFDWMGLR